VRELEMEQIVEQGQLESVVEVRVGDLLLVQDLDGVCMELVRDPLQRRLDPRYVRHARRLECRFCVLTNGEHAGYRGVNRLVEQALAGPGGPGRPWP
ncbi:MAG: glucosylglycerol 3-phosphatase, partial [Cyanobium sp.]